MKADEEHLLVDEGICDQITAVDLANVNNDSRVRGKRVKRSWCTRIYFFSLHAVVFIVCIELIRLNVAYRSRIPRNYDSPASSVVLYQEQAVHATDHYMNGKFSGPPSKDNEEAWRSLVEPTLVRATRDEMIAAGESLENATELADSSGFLASLGVYHEMHCLRRLRFYFYKDIFYPNISAADEEDLQAHVDHCLEVIRISLTCTADISLVTFRWEENNPKPRPTSNSRRYCVDWEALDVWDRRRSVGFSPRLKKPEWMA